MTVHIVTDSTSDISKELAAEYDITVVPLTISFGQESFRDGLDLTADEFYARLQTTKALPTTSQPPPALFQHAYEHLITRGDVVSVHVSHKFSGTIDTARAAARDVAPDRISVVDSDLRVDGSRHVRPGGRSRGEGRRHARGSARPPPSPSRGRLRIAVAFETLEYLRRGGRIGRAHGVPRRPAAPQADPHRQGRRSVPGHARPLAREGARRAVRALHRRQARSKRSPCCTPPRPRTRRRSPNAPARPAPACPLHLGRFGPVLGVHGGPGMLGIAVVEGA